LLADQGQSRASVNISRDLSGMQTSRLNSLTIFLKTPRAVGKTTAAAQQFHGRQAIFHIGTCGK
jgi:hypothetical protein